MPELPGFIGPDNQSRSVRVDTQLTENLYPERVSGDRWALYNTPGLASWSSVGSPVRALWAGEDRLFAVGGSGLYELNPGGGATNRGSVGSSSDRAQIFPNGTQVMVVSAGYVWIDTGTEILRPVWEDAEEEDDYVTASCGAYADGFFIIAKPNSRELYVSDLYDGKVWNPLDNRNKDSYPDNVRMILADQGYLWLIGAESAEVWQNTGDADFPFERAGHIIHCGIRARWTAVRMRSGPAWLGSDARGGAVAYALQGFVPRRVSTHAVEWEWRTYSTIEDAEAFSYVEHGHEFWVISFPSANRTWVYDATTELWHRRSSGAVGGMAKPRVHAYQFGLDIVGDWSGSLYRQSSDFYTEAGAAIYRRRRAQRVNEELEPIPYRRFTLNLDNDTNLTTTLRWSDDGGDNWTAAKPPSGYDRSHGHASRIVSHSWRRLGSGKDRVFEVEVTGNARTALTAAFVEAG
jgi:hypothetical protein